jgi:pimeloyl-ACP methyl ester carboxylesterase
MDALTAPSPLGLFREALGVLELPRLLLNAPDLAAQPKGSGQPVVLLPGYGAGDGSTALLRLYLRYLGYDACGWGLGTNTGDVPALIPKAAQLVAEIAAETRQPVRLIGWSLGGYLAREAARERPTAVSRVITLGSPVIGGPKYTAVADVYRRQGYDLDAIEAGVADRERIPLQVPVTAIYSKTDGVVAWRACIDSQNRNIEHVEVRTTHLGLGFAPDVYRVIAQRLASSSLAC